MVTLLLSWMLAKDTGLESETKGFVTCDLTGSMSFMFAYASFPTNPKICEDNKGRPIWIPTHTLETGTLCLRNLILSESRVTKLFFIQEKTLPHHSKVA
jgi:hypothetical protein